MVSGSAAVAPPPPCLPTVFSLWELCAAPRLPPRLCLVLSPDTPVYACLPACLPMHAQAPSLSLSSAQSSRMHPRPRTQAAVCSRHREHR